MSEHTHGSQVLWAFIIIVFTHTKNAQPLSSLKHQTPEENNLKYFLVHLIANKVNMFIYINKSSTFLTLIHSLERCHICKRTSASRNNFRVSLCHAVQKLRKYVRDITLRPLTSEELCGLQIRSRISHLCVILQLKAIIITRDILYHMSIDSATMRDTQRVGHSKTLRRVVRRLCIGCIALSLTIIRTIRIMNLCPVPKRLRCSCISSVSSTSTTYYRFLLFALTTPP